VSFEEWVRLLVGELRAKIPEVRAGWRGRAVVLRYGAREALIEADGDRAVVRMEDRVAFTPALEPGAARVIAESLAASFDVERWGRG
jgi:hypothetical protein